MIFANKYFKMDTYGLLISLAFVIALIGANETERISITPSDAEVIKFVNDSIFVLCNVPHNKSVHWRSPKGDVVTGRRGRVHVENKIDPRTQKHQLSLVFEHISLADKGNWSCGVQNDIGTAGFNLVVNQRITFVDTNTLQTVREGNEITLPCEVKGDPEPTVTWSYNGKNLDLTDNMPNKGKYRKLADGLLIKKVTQNDTGEYTCRAYQISDTISDTQDHTILLKIEHKPMWANPKDTNDIRYAYLSGEVNLTCDAIAEPPADFTWYRGSKGKKINRNEHRIFTEPYRSVLNIHVHNASYLGEYKCVAKNPLGDISRTIKLHEGIRPEAPSVFQLRGLNSHTFDVDVGSVRTSKTRHLMEVNGYSIEYITEYDFKLNGANWSYARRRDFPFEDGVTFLINNLEPNTTYLMRAAAKNLAGLSAWTKVEKFTTQSNEPPTNSAFKQLPLQWDCFVQTILVISLIAVSYSQFNSIDCIQWNRLLDVVQHFRKSSPAVAAVATAASETQLNAIKTDSMFDVLGFGAIWKIFEHSLAITMVATSNVLWPTKSTAESSKLLLHQTSLSKSDPSSSSSIIDKQAVGIRDSCNADQMLSDVGQKHTITETVQAL